MRKYADRVASTHSRNYLGYLTDYTQWGGMISTHSRNYLGYLTNGIGAQLIYLHTVEII